MTSTAPTAAFPSPTIPTADRREIADGVHVIPDGGVPLVPNVGIVVGDEAALVIDTGLGPANGERVLAAAREVAGDRKLFLTTTHYHCEHSMGAQAFRGHATFVANRAQRDEQRATGAQHVEFAASISPVFADLLADAEFAEPDLVYERELELDLGGRTVRLLHDGPGHTAGDQFVHLPEEGILFAGDVIENQLCPVIEHWSPGGVNAWLDQLDLLSRLRPATIVPGHGALGGPELIGEYRDWFTELRAKTLAAHSAGRPVAEYGPAVAAELLARRPGWGNGAFAHLVVESLDTELSRAADDRWRTGLQAINAELGVAPEELLGLLTTMAGDRAAAQAINAAGDAWSGRGLSRRERSLAILTILAAAREPAERLRPNIRYALRNGVSARDLDSLASLLFVYSGSPTGIWTARTFHEELAAATSH